MRQVALHSEDGEAGMPEGIDQAIEKAISKKLGQEFGNIKCWTPSELASIQALSVRHARDLQGLSVCPNLEVLVLVGCGITSIEELPQLDSLVSLSVVDSALRTLSGVKRWDLYSLRVNRNLIEDLEPLLELPNLKRTDVTGNPISQISTKEVIPKLTSRGIEVISPPERERSITLRLHAAGLPFSYYHTPAGFRLSRPGLDLSETPESGHPFVDLEEIEDLMSGPLESVRESMHGLFQREDLMWPRGAR
ncbi:hypothetical protein ACFXI8_26570 [Streptomyces niveus]|uniref:hypothetical protein n=1 Tax=Streptomyces niveus TaxID=193462 RepID=UPI0036ADDD18